MPISRFVQKLEPYCTPTNVVVVGADVIVGGSALLGAMATFCECVRFDSVRWEYIQHGLEYAVDMAEYLLPAAVVPSAVLGATIGACAFHEGRLEGSKKMIAACMLAAGMFTCAMGLKPAIRNANHNFKQSAKQTHAEVLKLEVN
jgi:hypothetical protein